MAWLDFLVKKETEWVILWQKCACACVFVLICPPGKSQFFVVVGWIWTFWTPWCSRRGWREGNIETFWLYAESYDSMLNDTSKPFTSKRTFPLVSSSFILVSFDSCTPLPASNLLQLFWLPAADTIWSPWALFLLVALLSPYSHMHLICTVTHEHPMLHILAFLPLLFIVCYSLWPALSFSSRETMERSDPGDFLVNQWVITCINIQSSVREQSLHVWRYYISEERCSQTYIHISTMVLLRYAKISHYWDKRRTWARH